MATIDLILKGWSYFGMEFIPYLESGLSTYEHTKVGDELEK